MGEDLQVVNYLSQTSYYITPQLSLIVLAYHFGIYWSSPMLYRRTDWFPAYPMLNAQVVNSVGTYSIGSTS